MACFYTIHIEECAMRLKGRKGAEFVVGALLFLCLMVLFSVTPIVQRLLGNPPESYPELFFAIYGIPISLILVCVSLIRYYFTNRR